MDIYEKTIGEYTIKGFYPWFPKKTRDAGWTLLSDVWEVTFKSQGYFPCYWKMYFKSEKKAVEVFKAYTCISDWVQVAEGDF